MHTQTQQIKNNKIQIKRLIEVYPAREPCTITSNTIYFEGILISINHKYARIISTTLDAIQSIPFDSSVILKTSIKAGSHCLHSIACTVAWKHEREMGLEFKTGARVGLMEIHNELNDINR